MKIRFSFHSFRQLRERNISRKLVEEILEKPQQLIEGKSNRKIAQKLVLEGKFKFLYRVIYIVEKKEFVVITAYKTTNVEKYLVKK